MRQPRKRWDAFICHATEDKDTVARPLARILIGRGLEVWYDEFSLRLGDSLRRAIEHGLGRSKFGIVVLSKNFFAKEWPQKELDVLIEREVRAKRKIILPLWHEVNAAYVSTFSPLLADRVAASTREGLENVADKILNSIDARSPKMTQQAPDDSLTLVDKVFIENFNTKLNALTKLLGDPLGSANVNDLIDTLIMQFKERIDKWDVPSLKFASRELFTHLYTFSERNGMAELYVIYKDLLLHAYSQRKHLLEVIIETFNSIMLQAWAPEHDLDKAEKAAKLVLRLGIDFLEMDPTVSRNCAAAIDNLAGDFFEPEILSKEIILAAHAFGDAKSHAELDSLVDDLADWIKINDEYSWEAGIKTYLIDSIDYAQAEDKEYNVDSTQFAKRFLYPALQENISQQIEGYANFIDELHAEEDHDLTYLCEELIDMIVAYERIRPKVSQEIRRQVLNKHNKDLDKIFTDVINSSKVLRKIYHGSEMILTFNELLKFLDVNSDVENVGLGITTYDFSSIDFFRKLSSEDRRKLEELVMKYQVKEYELTDMGFSFEMDSLVYLGNEQHDMSRLIDFLRDVGELMDVSSFSTGITFNIRKTHEETSGTTPATKRQEP